MISLVNSMCITLLFSVWIWALKQDIENLSRPAHDGPEETKAPRQSKANKGPVRRSDSALYDQTGKSRSKGGVATWTIA